MNVIFVLFINKILSGIQACSGVGVNIWNNKMQNDRYFGVLKFRILKERVELFVFFNFRIFFSFLYLFKLFEHSKCMIIYKIGIFSIFQIQNFGIFQIGNFSNFQIRNFGNFSYCKNLAFSKFEVFRIFQIGNFLSFSNWKLFGIFQIGNFLNFTNSKFWEFSELQIFRIL